MLAARRAVSVRSARPQPRTVAARKVAPVRRFATTAAPKDLLYTKSHEWIRVSGDIGTIGITDEAAAQLGDIVFVDLPDLKKSVKKGSSVTAVESVKAAADVYTPVTGQVVETNPALKTNPETVNKAPFTDGWMVKVKFSNAVELKDLLSPDQYSAHVKAGGK